MSATRPWTYLQSVLQQGAIGRCGLCSYFVVKHDRGSESGPPQVWQLHLRARCLPGGIKQDLRKTLASCGFSLQIQRTSSPTPLCQDAQPGAEMLPADWQIHGMRMHVGESQLLVFDGACVTRKYSYYIHRDMYPLVIKHGWLENPL